MLRKSFLKARPTSDMKKPSETSLPQRKLSGQGFKIVNRDSSPSPAPSNNQTAKEMPRRMSPFDQVRRSATKNEFIAQKREVISRNGRSEAKSFGTSLNNPLEQRKRSLK